MSARQALAGIAILIVAALVVASYYYLTDSFKPASSFDGGRFSGYFILAFWAEVVIGVPYALTATAILRCLKRRELTASLGVALVPVVLLLIFDRTLAGLGGILAPGTAIAAILIAFGWWWVTFRHEMQNG